MKEVVVPVCEDSLQWMLNYAVKYAGDKAFLEVVDCKGANEGAVFDAMDHSLEKYGLEVILFDHGDANWIWFIGKREEEVKSF